MAYEELIGVGALMALGGTFLVVFLGMYVYMALVLQSIAKRLKHDNPWWAWIPVLNIVQITDLVKMSRWWALIILASVVPFVGGLAMAAVMIWWWWIIAERLNYPGWYSLLLLIPIVNLIVLGMMAWSKR
jgi:hypothetical protein